MNLTEIKKENLKRIKYARKILNLELENGLITEDDVLSLLNKRNDYGFRNKGKTQSYKQSVLRDIFNSPFILCDQENLSLNIKQLLPLFLNCRYQMEIEELDSLLEGCFISKEDYEKLKKIIDFNYYGSSKDGKNILKTGHVDNLLDNKIKSR